MSKLLSVIIVSYNTKDLTCQTIASVLAEIEASSLLKKQTEIFLVDNHSQDNSLLAVKKLFKDIKFADCYIISNQKNLGFAQANNQAIDQAQGQYLFLLNSAG